MKKPTRLLASILVAALVAQLLSPGFRLSTVASAESQASARPLPPKEQWTEDTLARTDTSRTYEAGDYKVAEISAVPINYAESTGHYKPIPEAALIKAGNDFVADLGHFKVQFSDKEQGNRIRFDLGDGATVAIDMDESMPDTPGNSQAAFQAAAQGGKLWYRDKAGRMDYQYEVSGLGVKELITLHKNTGKHEWLFPLAIAGLQLQDAGNGRYDLIEPATGDIRGYIPAPNAQDADGNVPPTMEQTIVQTPAGPALRLAVDEGWLAAAGRQYPVIVDPSLLIAPKGADLMGLSISSSGPSESYVQGSTGYQLRYGYGLNSGTQKRILLKFDLSAVPRGAIVQSANLDVSKISYTGTQQPLGVYELVQEWNDKATWTQPLGSGATWTAGGVTGTRYGDLNAHPVALGDLAQAWVNHTRPNYGVQIRMDSPDPSDGSGYIENPTLQVTYSPDVISPTVSLSGITAGATVTGPFTVTISASDTAPGGIGRVDLLVDGAVVGTRSNPATTANDFAVDPRQFGPGAHSLRAQAYDFANNQAVSPTLDITVAIPEEPRSLVASLTTSGTSLRWEMPTDGQANTYNVYRMLDAKLLPNEADRIAAGVTGTSYDDIAALGTTTYYYAVTTVNASGVESRAAVAVATRYETGPAAGASSSSFTAGDALGLDSRWAFTDMPIPGGTAYLNVSTGNLVLKATDSVVLGPKLAQVFQRTYNSLAPAAAGILGAQGWSLNVVQSLAQNAQTGNVTLTEGDGTRLLFTHNADGSFSAPPAVWMTLEPATGTYAWKITRRDGIVYQFDGNGRMRQLSEPNNNVIQYDYDNNGRLTAVNGPATRQASLAYDGMGRLQAIHDAAGRTVSYGYDANNRLATVTDPLGQPVQYTYDSYGKLSAVTDAAGRTVTLTYWPSAGVTAAKDLSSNHFDGTVSGSTLVPNALTLSQDPPVSPARARSVSTGSMIRSTRHNRRC